MQPLIQLKKTVISDSRFHAATNKINIEHESGTF